MIGRRRCNDFLEKFFCMIIVDHVVWNAALKLHNAISNKTKKKF